MIQRTQEEWYVYLKEKAKTPYSAEAHLRLINNMRAQSGDGPLSMAEFDEIGEQSRQRRTQGDEPANRRLPFGRRLQRAVGAFIQVMHQ